MGNVTNGIDNSSKSQISDTVIFDKETSSNDTPPSKANKGKIDKFNKAKNQGAPSKPKMDRESIIINSVMNTPP